MPYSVYNVGGDKACLISTTSFFLDTKNFSAKDTF
jgi:hypothetical protein